MVKYLVDTNRSLSQVVAEYKPDGTITAAYTYVDDLISMTRGGQTYWYHFDGLGSTRMLTNEDGIVSDTYDYDAFGNLIARTGNTSNPFLFTGQRYDANSGFYHLRARYYQPGVGRFTAFDPWAGDVFAPATLHRYLYTANDPVNKIDPSGEFAALGSMMVAISMVSINAATSIVQQNLKKITNSISMLRTHPTYGNWGGEGWSGGVSGKEPPIDSMDECFKNHDLCYNDLNMGVKCEAKSKCDKDLAVCLYQLPKNPLHWKRRAKNPIYAEFYREWALTYFQYQY